MRRLITSVATSLLRRTGVSADLHQAAYGWLARRCGADTRWHFMNYGFDSAALRAHPIDLDPADDPDRCHIQLYHHLLHGIPIAGRHLLEIGCGRGGGAAYIHRYLGPARTVGLDLNQAGVRICASTFQRPGLTFVNGDAEALPFAASSFDVVVNVESSHGYASVERFLAEVRRVLRPGGFLLFADMRWAAVNAANDPAGLPALQRQLADCGLRTVTEGNISSGVCDALAAGEPRWRAFIRARIPRGLRWIFAELAGLPGSWMHARLGDGRLIYWSARLQKPPAPS